AARASATTSTRADGTDAATALCQATTATACASYRGAARPAEIRHLHPGGHGHLEPQSRGRHRCDDICNCCRINGHDQRDRDASELGRGLEVSVCGDVIVRRHWFG